MKLLLQQQSDQHKDVCSCIGWSGDNELISCGDDKMIYKWNMNGELIGKVCEVDAYVTDMHWFPAHSKRHFNATSAIFVIGCADGSYRLISASGRLEKEVKDAHKGAVVSLRWNYEGSALATGGEDGILKIWSRGGQLRSTLSATGKCIYSIAWGPTSEQVLFTCGKDLIIKPIHPASKQIQWKAHDGTVLKVDWNPLTKLIVSCGEDGRYKVWDSYGRNLFSSIPSENSITSVSWSSDGELFAVGSFNSLRICDKTGWSYTRQGTKTGSLMNIAWTSDGTQVAAAGGNGTVCFGQLIERKLEWRNIAVALVESTKVSIHDILTDNSEELEFRDKVIKMALGYSHLIVATASQCWIYDVTNWSTPQVFDLKDTVNLITHCKKLFLTVDNFSGIQLYTYEGRLVSSPKFAGLRPEFLDQQSLSLSNDMIAVIDKGEKKGKAVQLFDNATGKMLVKPLEHGMDILEVAINHSGGLGDRKIAFIDRNRDLYVCSIKKRKIFKLATMVDAMKWNDQTDMLVAICDNKFVVWYYPSMVYVDIDLLHYVKHVNKEAEIGRNAQILDFFGTKCNIRLWNGSIMTTTVSPYPLMLYEQVEKKEWKKAIRLCRFIKDESMWACLSGMAIKAGELNTAEVSLAALEEPEKLQYIKYIKEIPSVEGRNAELALYQKRVEEAETILLQAKLYYRAIKMHIRLFNWNKALEIAARFKTHIDTVKYYRKRYLDAFEKAETNPNFLQFESVAVDEVAVKNKIKHEKEAEAATGQSYVSEF